MQGKDWLWHKNKEVLITSTDKRIHDDQIQRQKERIKQMFELTTNFGSKITRWERCRDVANAKEVYINIDTLEMMHRLTAICEVCDFVFEQHEMNCRNCESMRSSNNMRLHRPLGSKDIRVD